MSEGGEWLLINLDDSMAKRQGLPPQIPVPKEEFEGLAEKGLPSAKARKWCSDFLNNSEIGKNGAWRKKNQSLVTTMLAFVDTGPLWDRAQKAFAENDYEKAIATLKKIVIQNDTDHAAKLNLASACANTGRFDDALKHFKAIRATFAGDAEFHVAFAHVHMRQQNKDLAIDEFVAALEAKPDHTGALDALTQLGVLAKIYENPRDATSLLYVRADSVADYLTGEWDKEPRTVDFLLEQVAYHERERRHAVVLVAAERAIQAAADAGSERAELARIGALRDLGRAADALAAAKDYATRAPKSAGAQVELARTLGASGDAAGAEAAVDAALAIDPGDLTALMLKFWPEDPNDIQKVNEILPALRAFVEAHGEHPGAWRTLARACLVVGLHDEALSLFEKAVGLRPDDDDLRSEWWGELAKQRKFDEMLADVAKLGDLKKRDWRLRWNEAEAYSGLGKAIEARACFTALNFDESLHVDVRKRAKRAANTALTAGSSEAGSSEAGSSEAGAAEG